MNDPSSRFLALLLPVRGSLMRFALHLTRDPVRADDLMQKALVAGLLRIDQLGAESAFRAWMSQIVYRTYLNDRKRSSRSEDREEPIDNIISLPAPQRTPAEEAEDRDLQREIASALAELPEDQARAVWLVDGQGFKFREAAEILDIPRGTAATLVLRGRRSLAERLKGLGESREVAK